MALKTISVSEDNYRTLKRLGEAGDSFNDVITELIGRKDGMKKGLRSERPGNHAQTVDHLPTQMNNLMCQDG